MAEFDVVGVGLNATDTLLIVPHFPAYAGKVPFEEEFLSPGRQAKETLPQTGLCRHRPGSVERSAAYRLHSNRRRRHRIQPFRAYCKRPHRPRIAAVSRSRSVRALTREIPAVRAIVMAAPAKPTNMSLCVSHGSP